MIYFVVMVMTLGMAALTTSYRKSTVNGRTINSVLTYKLLICLTALPTILVSGLRAYNVGTDTRGTYYYIFLSVYSHGISNIRDIGYAFINQLSLCFTDSYTGVLMLTSILCCGLAVHSIFKQSQNPAMSCLLFFTTNVFFISMNMIRQSIATMIFIVAIPYIKVGGIGVLVVGNILASLFAMIVTRVSYVAKYFSWYLTSGFNSGEMNWFSLFVQIGVMFFLIIIYDRAKNDGVYRIVLWLNFIALCILLISSRIPLAQRISWLFSFPNFVYLPGCMNYIKNKSNRKIISAFINVMFFAYMFITIFMRGYHDAIPYSSVIGI